MAPEGQHPGGICQAVEIVAAEVKVLDWGKPADASAAAEAPEGDDDLPF